MVKSGIKIFARFRPTKKATGVSRECRLLIVCAGRRGVSAIKYHAPDFNELCALS